MAEIVPDLSKLQFTDYNGKQVRAGDDYKAQLASGAANLNKLTGQNLSAEEYDRKINGPEADARWGTTAGSVGAYKPPSTPAKPQLGGLLNSAPASQAATAQQATASTYNPTMQAVSDKSTVQNQLANITDKDSALNAMAAADAGKAANRRGLLNSSMAVGAAQKAVLQSALPIAQQDAGTYAATDAANAQFTNSADQFNAGQKNAISTTNAQLGTQVNLANSAQILQERLAAIQSDTTLTAADKQIKSQQMIAENENKIRLQLQQIQSDTTLSAAEKQIKSQQIIASNQLASQQSISDKENATKLQLQQIDADTKKALATMDIGSKEKLTQVEADNKQLLQTNISAANVYAQYASALANISTSTSMDAGAKQQAADNQLAALQSALKAIGQVSGLDLSQYFQAAAVPQNTPTPAPNTGGDQFR